MSYPNPVVAVRDYLDARAVAEGSALRAFGGVPKSRPSRFTRLMFAGATDRSVAHRDARVVVESWNVDELQAERDADHIHEQLCEMATPDGLVPQGPEGWLGGPYAQPDPDSGTPRYVQTVIVRQGER